MSTAIAPDIAAVAARLGVPPDRVCTDPPPGTATTADLIRLHETNGKLYELVDGTLVEKPMGAPEAFLAVELGFHLRMYLATHDLGYLYGADVMIQLLPDQVRGPDVCFVRWPATGPRVVPRDPVGGVVPALVVEVLSPSNTRAEMRLKLGEYFAAGVELAWLIDPPSGTAQAYTGPAAGTPVAADGALDGGAVLPGFSLPLAALFARLAGR